MSPRAIVALLRGSGVSRVAHGTVRHSGSGSLRNLDRDLRIASKSRFVSYRIGSTRAEAWASQNDASTLVSSNFLEDSYASKISFYSMSRMGPAFEDGTRGDNGSLRWVMGTLLAATATAIVAARQEEYVPRWDPSHLLSRLSSQSCSASKLITSSMELVSSLAARSGSVMAAARSFQVQASGNIRVGQGVMVDEIARAGSKEAVGEDCTSTDDQAMGRRSIDDFYLFDSSEHPVGWGGYSTVIKGTSRSTGQAVAVKVVSREHSSRSELLEEVRLLEVAGKHPNVVTLLDVFEDKDAYYIVMELCKGGELFDRVADKGRYSEGRAARIMAEIAAAVGFLHERSIIHFDLKPENILLAVGEDVVPEVRLTDFGSAFQRSGVVPRGRAFTLWYGAPEVVAYLPVDEKADMWAVGMVMWVLLTGQHPFDPNDDLSEGQVAGRILFVDLDLKGPGIRHVSPEGRDLLRRLLAKDPEDRPSAREMLCHPWLRAVISRPEISGGHRQPARDVEPPGETGSEVPIVVTHGRRRRVYPEKEEGSPSQELCDSASGGELEDEICAGGAGSSRDDTEESAAVQNRRLRA